MCWLHLLSPDASRGGGQKRGAWPDANGRKAPLSPELWHCTAYPGRPGSHLGSTLKPGGAVLTLGVFRRSRSVAYVRADASPSEVHVTPVCSDGRSVHDKRPRNARQDFVKIRRKRPKSTQPCQRLSATASRASFRPPLRSVPRRDRRGSAL